MVLFFTCPLWALFMGALFLEEHLTGERILCVVMAMIGIALLINPWGEGIALSHLYGLAAGIMGGVNSVMTRHLRMRHSSQVIYAFQSFVGTLVSIPLITGRIRIPELVDGTILFISAVFGLLGQVAMNHGFRFIKAAEGATIVMTEAILTTLVGIILFHEPFTFTFVVGSIMILGSGIYLGLRAGNDTIGIDRE
jgi:drug/metabolite transporter (DMT)-like permease